MESVKASATGHSSSFICDEERKDSPRNIILVSNPVEPLLRRSSSRYGCVCASTISTTG